MLRAILSVIAGFAVMVVITMLLIPAAILLGTDRAFQPGTFQSAPVLLALDMVLGVAAALAGGAVCTLIARTHRPAPVLACFVVVMGLLNAVMEGKKPDPGPRTGPVSFQLAMEKGRSPGWYFWTLPIIGAAGVLAGRQLIRVKRPPGGTPDAT